MNIRHVASLALMALGLITACDDAPMDPMTAEGGAPHFHRARPITVPGQTEGFARDRLVVFDYTQNFFCPPATATGILPCVVGSAPAFPNALGLDPADEPDLFVIVPFFDANGDGELEALALTPTVDVQCPEPGVPFGECILHPPTLETPLGTIPLPNHSHVVRDTPGGSKPWDTFVVLVTDPTVWPDKNGQCAAKGECLTSVESIRALRADQTFAGTAILPSTLFLFFGVHGLR
ncbi:MAG: hypothetical protein ACT4PJ_13860 [Gemmatimonadaceae bacterium]